MRSLEHDAVHVWTVGLDVDEQQRAELADLLSQDEVERAGRYYFERDRRRFVAGRGVLRQLLGGYLDLPAEQLQFDYGERGKPSVPGVDLSFNVTNSDALALVAVTRGREVGIDVELQRQESGDNGVAEHFFAVREVATLRNLASELRPAAFLRCWTRKEAFIKARGDGLSLPLHDFEVTLRPDEPAALVWTAWSADEPAAWQLEDLTSFCPGFAAALAVRGRGLRIITSHWTQTRVPAQSAGRAERSKAHAAV
jgi:4'-phosphopantetheinyl transferase